MLAARLVGKRRIDLQEVPDPTPGPSDVLLRVQAVSICPGDLRVFEESATAGRALAEPLTLGHEFSGTVEALGEGVEGVAVGDRVAVEPSRHCGQCVPCRRGLVNLCRNVLFPTVPPTDGAMSEFTVCPAANTAVLPESASFEDGAMLEPLSVSVHAVRLGQMSSDEATVVVGAGAIGLGILQVLLAYGMRTVHVAEPRSGRCGLAEHLGAAGAVPAAPDLRPLGVEPLAVFEAAGTRESLAQALDIVEAGGRLIVVGIPKEQELTLDAATCRRNELLVQWVRRSRETLPEAVRLLSEGQVSFAEYPVQSFRLSEAQQAFDLAAAGMGRNVRIIVNPQEIGPNA